MLTADQIRQYLQDDPNWEPEFDASDEVWEMFESIKEELFGASGGDDEVDFDDEEWSDDEEQF